MDRARVDKAVVVALAGYTENEFVARVCTDHPDRLIPGASINPAAFSTPRQASAEAKKVMSDGRFSVLKLHPRLNHFDPMDGRCLAIMEEMANNRAPLPVWLDTYLRFPGAALRRPPVDTIHDLVDRFPSLTFLLLHACGTEVLQLAEAIGQYSNAILDISYTIHRYKGSSIDLDLGYLVRSFDRKVTFGSDFPEVSIREALADFDRVSLNLAEDSRERVLGENLRQILNL